MLGMANASLCSGFVLPEEVVFALVVVLERQIVLLLCDSDVSIEKCLMLYARPVPMAIFWLGWSCFLLDRFLRVVRVDVCRCIVDLEDLIVAMGWMPIFLWAS